MYTNGLLYPNGVYSKKSETFYLFLSLTFLTVIVFMIANMVYTSSSDVPNSVKSVEPLKNRRRVSLKKLTKEKHKKQKERDADRPFFSFLKKKRKVSESRSSNLLAYLREGVNNWWENKPLQRERFLKVPRGGYQLLTYQEFKMTMDTMEPVFLAIHLYKLKNLLEIPQVSNISPKVSNISPQLLNICQELSKISQRNARKRKNPFLLMDKVFNRLSGVVGFGIALRILTLMPLEPVDTVNIFETSGSNASLIRNYQPLVTPIPLKDLTNEVKNNVLVFQKNVTTESTGSVEVKNAIKNVNEITPSLISKTNKLKRRKSKVMRFSDLPDLKDKSTTEEIEEMYSNTPSIRISIRVK